MTSNPLEVYLVIGSVSYTATEVLKAIIRIFFPKAKVGIIISAIFNLLFVYGFGLGIIGRVFNVEYANTAIPLLFQHMDLITTAFVLCLVNKGVDKIIDTKKIANAHLFTEAIREEEVKPVAPIEPVIPEPTPVETKPEDHEVIINEEVVDTPEINESVKNREPRYPDIMYDKAFEDLITTHENGEVSQIGNIKDPYDEFDEYEDDFALSHMGGSIHE